MLIKLFSQLLFSIVDSLPKPHIPNPVPLFTGRQDEIAEITKVITNESTRLVNIWGSPGFGKTSTAIATAHHLLGLGYPVYFFKCQGISKVDEFLSKILSIFKSKLVDISLSPQDKLVSIFREISCSIILVFDNLDDLLLKQTSAKLITALVEFLDSSANVNVIFTSRELLETMRDRVKGFRPVRIRPMSHVSSVEFVRQLLPSFSESIVAKVVTISSHVPLAMKLVASLVENSSEELAKQVLEEIESCENRLQDIDSPYEKRMQQLFEASFDRLLLSDKHTLISLTAFDSPAINKDAAIKILSGEAKTALEIVRSLETLVKKSLIDVDQNCNYYTIHRLIFSFVKGQVQQSDFENVFKSFSIRFCRYYLLLFEKLNDDFLAGKSVADPELLETMQRVLSVMHKSILSSDVENCQLVFRILSKSEIFFSLIDVSFTPSLNISKLYDVAIEKCKSLNNDIALCNLSVSGYFQNIACSLFVKSTSSNMPIFDIHQKIDQLSNSLAAKLSCYEGIFDYYHGNAASGIQQIQKGLPGLQEESSDHQLLKCLCFQLLAVYYEHITELDKSRQFRELAIAFCREIENFKLFLIDDCGHKIEGVGESLILFNYLLHGWSKAFLSHNTKRHIFNSVYKLQQDKKIEGCILNYLHQILTYGDYLVVALGSGAELENICDEKIEFLNKSSSGFQESNFPYSAQRLLHLYSLKGSLMNEKGLIMEACRKALYLSLQEFGEQHRHTAKCYYDIGNALNVAEDYTSALNEFHKALDIILTVRSEPDDSDILSMLYIEIGKTYGMLNNDELAIASLEKALSVEESKKSNPDDIRISQILSWLSSLLCRSYNFTAALETSKRALRVRQKLFSEKRLSLIDMIESYLLVGRVQYTLGNYSDGKNSLEKALDLLKSSDYDSTYSRVITLFYVDLLDMKLDENVYMDVLQRTLHLIESHNRVFLHLLYLSVALRQLKSGKFSPCKKSLQKALKIELDDTLKEHPYFRGLTLIKFLETVNLLLNINEFKFAERTLDKAFRIVESLPQGMKDHWMFNCHYFRGIIHMNNRDYDLAIKAIEHALLELPKDFHDTLDKCKELKCLQTIAQANFYQGTYKIALSFLYRALSISRSCFPEGSEEEANTCLLVAKVAQKIENRSLFVQNLRLAYKVLSKVLGENHFKTQQCYISYARALISEV